MQPPKCSASARVNVPEVFSRVGRFALQRTGLDAPVRSPSRLKPAVLRVILWVGAAPAALHPVPIRAESPGLSAVISIAGAERLVPALSRIADAFQEQNPEAVVTVRGGGTTAALERLAEGEFTIAAASRPINAIEVGRLRHKRRIDPVGTPVALDAVMVYINVFNPLKSLTVAQAGSVFGGRVNQWSVWGVPFDDFERVVPDASCGTIAVFESETGIGGAYGRSGRPYASRDDLLDRVAATPHTIGFCRWGPHRGAVPLALAPGEESEPVAPSPLTIRERSYPLTHYLYLYTAGHPEGMTKRFVTFVLSAKGQELILASQSGPLPLPWPGNDS